MGLPREKPPRGRAAGCKPRPLEPRLTDQQIAEAIPFIRNSLGSSAPAISVSEVADMRKGTNPALRMR